MSECYTIIRRRSSWTRVLNLSTFLSALGVEERPKQDWSSTDISETFKTQKPSRRPELYSLHHPCKLFEALKECPQPFFPTENQILPPHVAYGRPPYLDLLEIKLWTNAWPHSDTSVHTPIKNRFPYNSRLHKRYSLFTSPLLPTDPRYFWTRPRIILYYIIIMKNWKYIIQFVFVQ